MIDTEDRLPPLIGESPAFLAAIEQASAAAPLERPILVIGERGTGKELVAARLHFLSPRWDKPYVKVNCAALSDQILESELFGHEAGAFTGAVKRHEGRFERADGGTLFLDEIATASDRVQEKVLRVIEYGQFERVGGTQTLSVDVRVLAATNEDLPAKAARGDFRADLLDRLAFDVITLPPLRARREDIAILSDHFGRAMAAELGASRFPGFSRDALETILAHPWPGNVRELRNTVERAVYRALSADPYQVDPIDVIAVDPFASPWRPGATPAVTAAPPVPIPDASHADDAVDGDFTARVAAFETRLLRAALAAEGGHQGRAAERLGLTYHQMRGLLRKHDLRARPAPGEAARA